MSSHWVINMKSLVGRALVALAIMCAVGVAVWPSVERTIREQSVTSIEQAVLSSAEQCCAVEGSYPSTLSYLEDHYGLTINHDDYLVTYEIFASNVAPTVVVTPR